MQRTVRYSDISAIIPVWLLSVAILISAVQLLKRKTVRKRIDRQSR